MILRGLAKAIAHHSLTGLNIKIFHDGLIFHTAIIINRKNWRITIKLYLENLSIFFFKKWTYTHARTPPPLVLFVFVRFSMTPPLLNERTFSMTPNLNMQNYVENMRCSLFCFRPEKSFLDKSSQKNQLSVKVEIWYQETNLNMRNSMMMLTFSVFDQKYLFVQIWSKKIKIVSLSWNFALD